MSEAVFKGSTDITLYFVLVDDATGLPLTGVAHTDVTGSYARTRGNRVAITLANLAAPDSAHSDGGWEEVDSANQPGLYRFDIPDAAFATGARAVIVTVEAAGAKAEHQYIPLWDWNTQVAAIPNAAADAAGGLPISDAGGLDLDGQRSDVAAILVDTGTTLDGKIDTIDGNVDAVLADTNELQTDWANGGRLDNILDARASQASVDTIAGFLDTEIAAILADTNELQTDWTNGGRLDLLIDAIKAKTDALPTDPADQSAVEAAIAAAQVAILAKLLRYVQVLARSDAAIATDNDAELDEINADEGSGAGDYANTTDALEALRDNQQPAAAAALTAYDPPTHAELVSETNDVQADIATRASQASVDVIDNFVDDLEGRLTAGRAANLDNLDATVSSRATPAQVNSEVDTALADVRLDELLAADSDIDGATPPVVGSVVHEMLSKSTGSFTFDQTTDSLEALADSSGGGGDPWATALPGAYGAGTAGNIVGNRLDVAVGTRLATAGYTAPDNAGIASILARLGAFAGSGVNTVLGFLRALARKDLAAPSDMGGAYDPATDSLEAIRDRGDNAWTGGGGGGGAVAVTVASPGDTLTIQRGDTIAIPITGLGSLTGRTALYVTVKSSTGVADTDAIIQIEETDGLVRLNKAATTAAWGEIEVTDTALGGIILRLAVDASSLLSPKAGLHYDVQVITADGPSTRSRGLLNITDDVTWATS